MECHLQIKHKEYSWCTGWETTGTAVVVRKAPGSFTSHVHSPLLKPSTTLVSAVVRKHGPGENLGAQEFVMAFNSSVPAGTAWKPGSPTVPWPLFGSDMSSTSHSSLLLRCLHRTLPTQQLYNCHIHIQDIHKKSLVLKKWLFPSPVYITASRAIFDFWKHNTIYHCLSKENYRNVNWLDNLHIWFFKRWYKVGFKKEADIQNYLLRQAEHQEGCYCCCSWGQEAKHPTCPTPAQRAPVPCHGSLQPFFRIRACSLLQVTQAVAEISVHVHVGYTTAPAV